MHTTTKLYRGDSHGPHNRRVGPTLDLAACFHGLTANYIDGGHSDLLRGLSFVDFVLKQVAWEEGTPDEQFKRRSPLISFSSDPTVAKQYMVGRGRDPKSVEPCPLHLATHFMYELTLAPETLRASEFAAVWALSYHWSMENCLVHMERAKVDKPFIEIVAAPMFAYSAAERAANHVRSAKIVNVVEFLTVQCDEQRRENALRLASDDKEWLVYPADPMGADPAPSAQFRPNRHLSVAGYRLRS